MGDDTAILCDIHATVEILSAWHEAYIPQIYTHCVFYGVLNISEWRQSLFLHPPFAVRLVPVIPMSIHLRVWCSADFHSLAGRSEARWKTFRCIWKLDLGIRHVWPFAVFCWIIITFRVSRRRREMYCGHPRLCVCLSAAACPHCCTDPDVTWGSGRGCFVVVHYCADLQSGHGLRCYGNITRTRDVSEYMLVLALCLLLTCCSYYRLPV